MDNLKVLFDEYRKRYSVVATDTEFSVYDAERHDSIAEAFIGSYSYSTMVYI